MKSEKAYKKLIEWSRHIFLLESTCELLGWDQNCYIPEKGHHHRGEQIAYLSRIRHNMLRDPSMAERLEDASQGMLEDDSPELANIREWRRWHHRATKVPMELTERLARITTEAKVVWEKARKESDWDSFVPYLEEIVKLKRQEAEAIGYMDVPYDALFDTYEPGMTTHRFSEIVSSLIIPLKQLLDFALEKDGRVDDSFLFRYFPVSNQETFGRMVAQRIGYDFHAGRLDVTAHPFTAYIGPGDVRITTRYNVHDFKLAFFSILHEVGHALYDQGLDMSHWGTPCGMPTSLGIHESQSRFWENMVGRSFGFWKFFYPRLIKHFPILTDISLHAFWRGINLVKPSLIRIEADEVTYAFHIIIRFKIEKNLINNNLTVREIPDMWNELMRQYLGIIPKHYSKGVLQDVHWSAGLFGYFPVYLLGSIYAAQFCKALEQELSPIDELCSRGEFLTVLKWFRERIHCRGRCLSPTSLVRHVTGKDANIDSFIMYIKKKVKNVYLEVNS